MRSKFLTDDFFGRLETLSVNLQTSLTGYFGGKHLIKKYGQTVEFADFREYRQGDDVRKIDWNLYARLEKYFLKLFTDERQMHVRIYIDCSASMGVSEEKAEYALSVAAAIGFLAVQNTDKVSFRLIYGDRAENPFGTIVGKNSFYMAIGALENVVFKGEAKISDALSRETDSGENDGLSVIISDFFTEADWKEAVDYLVYKKQQVLLFQTLSEEEADPRYSGKLELVDCEGTGVGDERNVKLKVTSTLLDDYDKILKDMIGEIKEFCLSRGAAFISADTRTPIEKVIFGALSDAELVK